MAQGLEAVDCAKGCAQNRSMLPAGVRRRQH
jgi:hypothetical protein